MRSRDGIVPNAHDDMRELILSTLVAICRDKAASPASRTAAARTLAEVLGLLKQAPRVSPGTGPVGELSEAELDALIQARAPRADTVSAPK